MAQKRRRLGRFTLKFFGWFIGVALVLSLGWSLGQTWLQTMESKGCNAPKPLFHIDRFQKKQQLRFVVIGDAGTGRKAQKKVAETLATLCQQKGCDFVLYLGDNIYPNGVSSVNDPRFETQFAEVYQDVQLPFYAVLGNHDARGDVEAQRLYSLKNPKWRMPEFNYRFSAGPVEFFGVNSNCIPLSWFWLKEQLSGVGTGKWRMVFTHHNLFGSGHHRDAPWPQKLWWKWNLAEQVDVFFSGHEHVMEHLQIDGVPGEYFISGAGGFPYRGGKGDSARPGSKFLNTSAGLLWVQAKVEQLEFEFFDLYGAPLYQYQKERTK